MTGKPMVAVSHSARPTKTIHSIPSTGGSAPDATPTLREIADLTDQDPSTVRQGAGEVAQRRPAGP